MQRLKRLRGLDTRSITYEYMLQENHPENAYSALKQLNSYI